MVGAAGSDGRGAKSENNYADRTSGGAKYSIIGGDDAIGIVHQILRVLQTRLAERGVDVDRDPAAGAGSHKLRSPPVAGPWRRCRAVLRRFFPSAGCFYAVIRTHTKNLQFGQNATEVSERRVTAYPSAR